MLDRVKTIIEVNAFTPSRFADHIGVPRSTVSHILSGRNKPSLEVVQRMLDAFPELSAKWLISGKGQSGLYSGGLFDQTESGQVSSNINLDSKESVVKTFDIKDDIRQEEMKKPSEIKQDAPKEMKKTDETKNDDENIAGDPVPVSKNDMPAAVAENKQHYGKKSVKVIVVYSDGTYSEYLPAAL